MDYRIAEFVRFIEEGEEFDDLLDETKAQTWTKEREHAVVVVRVGEVERFAIIRGGRDGIVLERGADDSIVIPDGGEELTVLRLAWHIHPEPTGPSDHDRHVLDALGQHGSMLYEIGGPTAGSRFTRWSERKV